MSNITITQVGNRLVATGNTFPVKDRLKEAGFTYDVPSKSWWTDSQDVVDKFNNTVETPGYPLSAKIIVARAYYDGQPYYVLYEGLNDGKPIVKLGEMDGSSVFWAKDPEHVDIIETYKKPKSIAELQNLTEIASQRHTTESVETTRDHDDSSIDL